MGLRVAQGTSKLFLKLLAIPITAQLMDDNKAFLMTATKKYSKEGCAMPVLLLQKRDYLF